MTPQTIYLRHTDKQGKSYVDEHRCWDSALFIEAQLKAAKELGGKSSVDVVTRQTYQEARQRS